MKVTNLLLQNQKKIYNFFSSLDIPENYFENLEKKDIKNYLSSNKNLDENSYTPNFKFVDIKNKTRNRFLEEILDDSLVKLFSNECIYTVHYFEVWGDVIEHTDSKGLLMGYPCNDYNTLVMALQVPSEDPEVFTTYYNRKPFKLQQGVFEDWDVTRVPHSWQFDFNKCNKYFKWLRVDVIENQGLDIPFKSLYNSNVAASRSISFF